MNNIKIGIFIEDTDKIFENGCNQQAFFVYQLFNSITNYSCKLISINKKCQFMNFNIITIGNKNIKDLLQFNIIISLSKI